MATYKQALDWIIWNDDTDWIDAHPDTPSVTACLVADLFGKTLSRITADLIRRRKQTEKENANTNTEIAEALMGHV